MTRMNWEDFDGETIHMTQQKTGRVLRIPCPAILKAQLAIHRPKVMNLRGKTPILSIRRKIEAAREEVEKVKRGEEDE